MKIIHEGKLREQKPDYVGKRLTCPNCRAEIELEEGDSIAQEKRPGGRRWFKCPTEGCETQIDIPVYRGSFETL